MMRRVLISLFAAAAVLLALPVSSGAYLWCDNADQIYASVYGGSVTIYHSATVYNCCPDYFEYDVVLEAGAIFVDETEILAAPCDCMCCFNLSITIQEVPPGEHDVTFRWFDYETNEYRQQMLHVVVPDNGQEGSAAIFEATNSGCVEITTVPDPLARTDSWGRIKAIYR